MRVLVTGAAGFLGRHVTRQLLAEGFRVTGFDLNPVDEPRVEWSIGDLRSLEDIRDASRGHDAICHVGAIGDVYLAAANPALAAAVNVTGSANVAEAALLHDCRVVYASTWEVYGRSQYEPVDEDHPCTPDHPYNVTKLAGEQILLAADRLRGVSALALRLGTAYGTGLRPNSVFSVFIDRAHRVEPIIIQGDGSQCRQFTHVSDIARAFVLACRTDTHG
ncbi:MAG TPA: NAD-dependent epimerase/dehydratase family protein, partial [Acidimicrobiia bacterium]|nr:NAD-dependent epimerase/dehydratase family protein [Acidimicrobiia bacterium]